MSESEGYRPGEVLVVAAAIVDGDRLLLAQRDYPPAVAGLWELPGGKVQAGESRPAALAREVCEELDVEISVGTELADVVRPKPGLTLVAMRAVIVAGTPRAVEHRALEWVDFRELLAYIDGGKMVPNDLGWAQEMVAELQLKRRELS